MSATEPKPAPKPEPEDLLGRAMLAVLERERDPRAAAWLRGLLEGDDPPRA